MITVRLDSTSPPGAAQRHRYRVAGCEVVCDLPLAGLARLACGGAGAGVEGESGGPAAGGGGAATGPRAREVFAGEALVAGAPRYVRCVLEGGGYRLEIAGVGAFAVAADGGRVALVTAVEDPALVAPALLGAPLILALALRGTFCLHASAVARGGRAVAFLGGSGAGKSTLAAFLSALADGGWRRLADDLLPWAPEPSPPHALPHFPQAALDGDLAALPERLPLAAFYLLDPRPDGGEDVAAAASPVPPRRAALALVRHTVAARLFAPELLTRHAAACATLAAAVPVCTLTVPWRLGAAAAVSTVLAADLAAGPRPRRRG